MLVKSELFPAEVWALGVGLPYAITSPRRDNRMACARVKAIGRESWFYWYVSGAVDGMILEGLGRLVRRYPHVPGIDFAGTVERSDSSRFKPGDKVFLTGWRVGELHWGGYPQRARVKSDWLVRLPEGLTTEHAMAVGTASFTAMLAIMALEHHGLRPGDGAALVMGAASGERGYHDPAPPWL